MMGQPTKVIITTGTFTLRQEARRDGVPPIELVDGDLLVDMFERLELGLIRSGLTTLMRSSSMSIK
jgi:restriction system protein